MDMRDEMKDTQQPGDSSWPYASMIGFGYFGANTPEGRRLAVRTLAALAVVCAGLVGLSPQFPLAVRLLSSVGLVGGVAFMFRENVVYVRGLDELSQMLQVQAMAVAYGAVWTIVAVLYATSLLLGPLSGPVWLVGLVLAEPIRGYALARLARRHE